MQFGTQPSGEGKYMIHCHNLVHEDHDMMVQFSAGNPQRQRPRRVGPPGPGHDAGGLLPAGLPPRVPTRDLR